MCSAANTIKEGPPHLCSYLGDFENIFSFTNNKLGTQSLICEVKAYIAAQAQMLSSPAFLELLPVLTVNLADPICLSDMHHFFDQTCRACIRDGDA